MLLVEDNTVNQYVGRALLERLGCEVALAPDSDTALDLLADRPFDLVFMDVHMPGRDGPETTRLMRRAEPADRRVPVIALRRTCWRARARSASRQAWTTS